LSVTGTYEVPEVGFTLTITNLNPNPSRNTNPNPNPNPNPPLFVTGTYEDPEVGIVRCSPPRKSTRKSADEFRELEYMIRERLEGERLGGESLGGETLGGESLGGERFNTRKNIKNPHTKDDILQQLKQQLIVETGGIGGIGG
jgi:hypothetical protein